MSKTLGTLPKTGRDDVPLTITQFCGPTNKGMMVQLTQGVGGQDCPGYIELTEYDAWRLFSRLEGWFLDNKKVKNDSLSTT